MDVIHSEGFWFVHISFVSVVKYWYLTQFPVDHLPHPIMYILVFLLYLLAVFAYNVIKRFIFVTT